MRVNSANPRRDNASVAYPEIVVWTIRGPAARDSITAGTPLGSTARLLSPIAATLTREAAKASRSAGNTPLPSSVLELLGHHEARHEPKSGSCIQAACLFVLWTDEQVDRAHAVLFELAQE